MDQPDDAMNLNSGNNAGGGGGNGGGGGGGNGGNGGNIRKLFEGNRNFQGGMGGGNQVFKKVFILQNNETTCNAKTNFSPNLYICLLNFSYKYSVY